MYMCQIIMLCALTYTMLSIKFISVKLEKPCPAQSYHVHLGTGAVPALKGIVYIPKDVKTLGSTGSFQAEVSVASVYNSQGMIPRLLFCRTDPRTHRAIPGSRWVPGGTGHGTLGSYCCDDSDHSFRNGFAPR